MVDNEEFRKWMLRHRHVQDPCSNCRGFGTRPYASGATWRGGMGTASITWDVCDTCWGSGDTSRPWVNLRKLEDEEQKRVFQRAAGLFSERCGISFQVMRPGLLELCSELDKFSRQRRKRPQGFDTAVRCLAGLLRDLLGVSPPDGEASI